MVDRSLGGEGEVGRKEMGVAIKGQQYRSLLWQKCSVSQLYQCQILQDVTIRENQVKKYFGFSVLFPITACESTIISALKV